jgi:hypothetical protein
MGIAAIMLASGRLGAATNERIVTDWHTGLAIDGYDPVAYFTDGEPMAGRPEFELHFDGVVWRFRNEGNRAEFSDHPAIYQPRYGGYDPVGVARGVAAPGNPLLWTVSGERLYLFHSPEAQAEFAADAQAIIAGADDHWPEVRHSLAQ